MTRRLLDILGDAAAAAIHEALGVEADADLRPTNDPRFGDYQINGVLPLAKQLRDNPRKLAASVVEVLGRSQVAETMLEAPEIAGPGFINLRLKPGWVGGRIARMACDERLAVEAIGEPETIVIDYSSPNVAKRMHVGHLRSTIIGAALYETLGFLGHRVIGDNHVGDWGTQFGILIWAWKHHGDAAAVDGDDPIGELERLYKLGTAAGKDDDAVAEACRAELAKLQAGDADNLALWQRFVDISRREAESIYERLDVSFDEWLGESAYNDQLAPLVDDLVERGIAGESQGAIVIKYPEGHALEEKPFLIRKRDGAFLYATTDLATIEYRVRTHEADRIIYVVDTRQSHHFKSLFAAAEMLGYEGVSFEHVGFGMMLGPDGRPFKTREGKTPSLAALLDEAEERILPMVAEKWPDATEGEQREIAAQVGIGAVKYADLSPNLSTDYKFEWDKLLSADGNTGPYLQYALVRCRSVGRKYAERFGAEFVADEAALELTAPEELEMARALLGLEAALDRVAEHLTPHVLCEYLYGLARTFSHFYYECPILESEGEVRRARMTLCLATQRTLELGLKCLGIPRLDRM